MLPKGAMHSTHLVSAKPARRPSQKAEAQIFPVSTPSPVVAEINGYIAVRDQLLAAAEEQPTTEALCRVTLANELVQDCLQAARHPYEAQVLSEPDATRERSRCQAVISRIAKLIPDHT